MTCRKLLFALFLQLITLPLVAQCEVPFELPSKSELLKIRSAVISTTQGDFLVRLYPDVAPWHVANFKYLADKGFYKNLRFHLYKEDYIIQGGDPTGTGDGGPGYNLRPEFSSLRHVPGTLGMARRADDINPERLSNGSQFHILLSEAPHMDKKYTIFGKVIDGMSSVDKLRQGDLITNIRVYVRQD